MKQRRHIRTAIVTHLHARLLKTSHDVRVIKCVTVSLGDAICGDKYVYFLRVHAHHVDSARGLGLKRA